VPLAFEHETKGQRVLFGSGAAAGHLRDEVARFAALRPLVIAADRQRGLIERAGLAGAVRYHRITEHVPVEVAEDARAAAAQADLVIAIGGGSAIGLAKAVALTSGLPIIATPTTFAGSEATDVWGLTERGQKRTGVDPRVLPRTVVYDAELLESLPVELAVASGLNAVAHCVDSMWGPRADPINAALAMAGLHSLAVGLPGVVAEADRDAIEQSLYGCYLAAVAFASAGSGLHHKICHVLAGAFNLPHAATHAIVLPHVLAFNAPYAPRAAEQIAQALGSGDACQGLDELRARLNAPRALRELGLAEDDLAAAAQAILPQVPAANPRPVEADTLDRLLRAAWAGDQPRMESHP
jgi:alcohol dehydrogenase class IV